MDRAALAERETEAAVDVPRTENRAERLVELAEALARAEDWLVEAAMADDRATSLAVAAVAATTREGEARRRAERARSEATAALASADECRSEAARRSAEPVDPGAGPGTEVLRAEAVAARAAHDTERAGRDLTRSRPSGWCNGSSLRRSPGCANRHHP